MAHLLIRIHNKTGDLFAIPKAHKCGRNGK